MLKNELGFTQFKVVGREDGFHIRSIAVDKNKSLLSNRHDCLLKRLAGNWRQKVVIHQLAESLATAAEIYDTSQWKGQTPIILILW